MTRWNVHRADSSDDEGEESKESLPESAQQALDALQYLWGVTGQAEDHLMEMASEGHEGYGKGGHQHGEGCAASVGFGGLEQMSEGGDSSFDREEAVTKMRAAWKTTMAREGKLTEDGGLGLGPEGKGKK